MATQQPIEGASAALKYTTWVLKVSIHCEGCRKKVKKTLQSMDGVFTVSIEAQQHKVTVTGNIEVQTLIKKLSKAGKHAELWSEKLVKEERKAGNSENKNNKNKTKERVPKGEHSCKSESQDKAQVNLNSTSNSKANNMQPKESNKKKSPEKTPTGQASIEADKKVSETQGSAEKSSAKKKKKGHPENEKNESNLGSEAQPAIGIGQVNLDIPTIQDFHSFPQPQGLYYHTYPVLSHNFACSNKSPAGPYYCVPPPPFLYMYGNGHQNVSVMQERPSVPLDIFSDENVNGCHVM